MKSVWLASSDAVHEIACAYAPRVVDVFETKRGVLSYWKNLGNVEPLPDEARDKNELCAVWHRITGENVLLYARKRLVNL